MWTKSRSLKLTKIMTLLSFAALAYAVFRLPHILTRYLTAFGHDRMEGYLSLLITLYAAAAPAAILLFCLYRLLLNMGKGDVFIPLNVTLMRVISWCCFLAAVIFGVFCFRYTLAVLIAAAAGFIGLIVRVVKNAFEQAIQIKTENDFTI